LKQILLGTTKVGGHKQMLGALPPNTPLGYGPVLNQTATPKAVTINGHLIKYLIDPDIMKTVGY